MVFLFEELLQFGFMDLYSDEQLAEQTAVTLYLLELLFHLLVRGSGVGPLECV